MYVLVAVIVAFNLHVLAYGLQRESQYSETTKLSLPVSSAYPEWSQTAVL